MGGLGLGAIAGQLADLQLGELLDTPPPGLDEAVAIAKASCTAKHAGQALYIILVCRQFCCLRLHIVGTAKHYALLTSWKHGPQASSTDALMSQHSTIRYQ